LPRCKVEVNLEVKLYVVSEGMLALKTEICEVLRSTIVGSKDQDFYSNDVLNAEKDLFITIGYYQGFHPREFEVWLNDQLSKNTHALPEFFVNGLSFSEEWSTVSISNESIPFTAAKPANINPHVRDRNVEEGSSMLELDDSFNGGEITFPSAEEGSNGQERKDSDDKRVGRLLENANIDSASIDSTSTTPFLLRDSELEGKLDLEGLLGQYMNISSKQAETLAELGMQLITDLDDKESIPNVSLPTMNAEGTSLMSENTNIEAVRNEKVSANDLAQGSVNAHNRDSHSQKDAVNNISPLNFSGNMNHNDNNTTEEENYYDFDMDEFVKKYLLEESESTPVDAATWEVYGLFGTLNKQGALQAVAGAEGATLNNDVPTDVHGVLPVLNAIVKQKMEVEALNDHNTDVVEQMKAKLDLNISLQSPPESSSLYDPPTSKLMFNDIGLHDDTNLVEVDHKILETAVGVVTTENSTLIKTKKGTIRNWICSSCKAVVFGRRTKCFKCKTFRADTASTSSSLNYSEGDDVREGDWVCTVCEGHNFANKLACFTCRAPRPPGFVIPVDTGANKFEKRPGDWQCPKCNEMVFAKRNRCYRCGSGKAKK
jgi:hypothetical protein